MSNDPNETIRVVRVLEFIGPRWWVEETLEKSWLRPEKAGMVGNREAKELVRVVEVVND